MPPAMLCSSNSCFHFPAILAGFSSAFLSSFLFVKMKKSGFFAASLAAASATALSASSSSPSPTFSWDSAGNHCSHQEEGNNAENSSARRSSSTEKFAPRFDGLRFIETLVTAHR